jgi:hypothetical protein
MYERIPPKAVKFEDVKDSVRADLVDRLSQVAIQNLRQQLSMQVLQTIQVLDPTLKKQFMDRLTKQQQKVKDPDEIRKEMERDRERTSPSTLPIFKVPTQSDDAVAPSTPATRPAPAAPAAAPAATNPASSK